MVFSSSSFLFLFLPIAVIGYWVVSRISKKLRNAYLFLVSMVFYCWNGTQHALLLLFSVAANYLFALLIQKAKKKTVKKLFLSGAVVTNVGLLGYFKYTNFFLDNLSFVTGKALSLKEIVLPLGISFYTFQALSYVIDIYRGEKALNNPMDLGMYITFFPQLIAGPIVRYGQIREKVHERSVSKDDWFEGFQRFLTGLCKKVILANHLGELADRVFSATPAEPVSVFLLWLGAIAYMLQIYYDFSGYSDMAIGLGKLFGFSFPENFNYPYAAATITDFWRRWHMTLSGWFRDYIYIPLGGSREGIKKHVRNLLIVWLLTGLWHGAAWHYVFWGFTYFLLLIIEKYCLERSVLQKKAGKVIYRILTLIFVCLLWVVFRASSFTEAFRILGGMMGLQGYELINTYGLFQAREYSFYLIAGILFCVPVIPALSKKFPAFSEVLQAILLLLGTILSIAFILKEAYNPFLYFQF